jgi:hypothetical protein
MLRILSIFNSKKTPCAFILCLLILIGVEVMVRRNVYAFTSSSNTILLYKKNLVKNKQFKNYNALIMGDSRALGMQAKEISEIVSAETGGDYQFFNYSFPQSGVQNHFLLLKNYLKHQKAPKLIVLISSPIVLTGEWNLQHLEKPYPSSFYC